MIKFIDNENNFFEIFDPNTGLHIRSGMYENGQHTDTDPFMRVFPSLIDIGIMGHCIHGKSGLCIKSGVQCYQDGLNINESNMSITDYKKIIDESKGSVFQVALGGRGDPDQHENFEEILKYTRENNIVPNFTSSGLGFTPEIAKICKKYCGSVAISYYRSEYTTKAIQMLLDANVKTNIHYVLSNSSIDEAIEILEKKTFNNDINAIIFLLHKPIGLGQYNEILSVSDQKLIRFFELIDTGEFPWKIGFDSCTVSGLINLTKNIEEESMEACEAARFSMYITPDMIATPCSFDNQNLKWGYDIKHDSIQNAWDSDIFNDFRCSFKNACHKCNNRQMCFGGCPIINEITLCNRKERCYAK